MAYRSSTSLALASAANAVISVPASVAADDIVVVTIYIENNTKTITPPAGFTQKYGPDSITAEHHTYWLWKRLTGADSGTYTFSWTGAEPRQAAAVAFSGRITTGDPFDTTHQSSALATTNFANLSVTAVAGADAMVMFSTWTSGTLTGPTGFTERVEVNEIAVGTQDNVTGGTLNANSAVWSGSSDLVNRLGTIKSAVSLALDQEGFRWRNDDGSETTATWKAAQDTNVSIAPDTTTRLRMLVNATSDPPNEQYKLQYRKSGAADWRDIDTDG